MMMCPLVHLMTLVLSCLLEPHVRLFIWPLPLQHQSYYDRPVLRLPVLYISVLVPDIFAENSGIREGLPRHNVVAQPRSSHLMRPYAL